MLIPQTASAIQAPQGKGQSRKLVLGSFTGSYLGSGKAYVSGELLVWFLVLWAQFCGSY